MDPKELQKIKENVVRAISPIRPAVSSQPFWGDRTDTGSLLPESYLVYFMLVDLLDFPSFGRHEKVAWSIVVEYNQKDFVVQHRKLGFGIFVRDKSDDEKEAQDLAKKLQKGVRAAGKYFDFLASKAVSESRLNVINRCAKLHERYRFFRRCTEEKNREAESVKEVVDKKESKEGGHRVIAWSIPYYDYKREADYFAAAAIESFFGWTEHLFIHLSILLGTSTTGEKVAKLAGAEWGDKFKAVFDLKDSKTKNFFDEITTIRRQLRNFLAHGAFGKNGEAFLFHSTVGAVPVLMPHKKKNTKFTLYDDLSFTEDDALATLEDFEDFLWNGSLKPARLYLQETDFPSILTLAQEGKYKAAMTSEDEMNDLLQYLSYIFDRAANMEW